METEHGGPPYPPPCLDCLRFYEDDVNGWEGGRRVKYIIYWGILYTHTERERYNNPAGEYSKREGRLLFSVLTGWEGDGGG